MPQAEKKEKQKFLNKKERVTMETISLVKEKQKDLDKRVTAIKKAIKSKSLSIKENGRQKSKLKRKPIRKARATIYLGHIPHGFYENEMMSYFSQFGKVMSATVARSRKTGRSRGYGFVEFRDEEVAKIAAETMDNYLMFNRLLKCKYIPPEERKTFVTKIDPLNYPKKINRIKSFKEKNAAAQKLTKSIYQKKTEEKIKQFKKFFEEKGIDFSFNINSNSVSDCEKSNDESDVQLGVLEIDESDSDIHFTTPPQVKKVIRKSCNSSTLKTPSKKIAKHQLELSKQKQKQVKTKNAGSMENDKDEADGTTPKRRKSAGQMVKAKENTIKALEKIKSGKSLPVKTSPKLGKSSCFENNNPANKHGFKEKSKKMVKKTGKLIAKPAGKKKAAAGDSVKTIKRAKSQ